MRPRRLLRVGIPQGRREVRKSVDDFGSALACNPNYTEPHPIANTSAFSSATHDPLPTYLGYASHLPTYTRLHAHVPCIPAPWPSRSALRCPSDAGSSGLDATHRRVHAATNLAEATIKPKISAATHRTPSRQGIGPSDENSHRHHIFILQFVNPRFFSPADGRMAICVETVRVASSGGSQRDGCGHLLRDHR